MRARVQISQRDARDHALMRAQAIAGSSWPKQSDKSTRSSVSPPPPPALPSALY